VDTSYGGVFGSWTYVYNGNVESAVVNIILVDSIRRVPLEWRGIAAGIPDLPRVITCDGFDVRGSRGNFFCETWLSEGQPLAGTHFTVGRSPDGEIVISALHARVVDIASRDQEF
jgi:hypothetical protein